MKTYILAVPTAEVVHLLRVEVEAAHGAPELDIGGAGKEYILEEDFDRCAYGIHDGEQFDLVTSITTLTIEPRVEAGYWVLELVIERALGPVLASQEDDLTRRDLTLDEFEAELAAPETSGSPFACMSKPPRSDRISSAGWRKCARAILGTDKSKHSGLPQRCCGLGSTTYQET